MLGSPRKVNVVMSAIILAFLVNMLVIVGYFVPKLVQTYLFDYSHWFEYVEIIPNEGSLTAGTTPWFTSKVKVYKNSTLEWDDAIRCAGEDGVMFFSSQSLTSGPTNISNGVRVSQWEYAHPLPDKAGLNCCLYSSITVKVPESVQHQNKTQHIGPTCFIVEPKE